MSRGLLAGLVVGVVGNVALFVVHGLEDLFIGSVRRWFERSPGGLANPGSLGLSASMATMASAVLTLVMGMVFGVLFQAVRPAMAGKRAAVRFGLMCWLGFLVPVEFGHLLWTKAPMGAAALNLIGWLLMFGLGGLIAFRLTK